MYHFQMYHFQCVISGEYHRYNDLDTVGIYVYHVMRSQKIDSLRLLCYFIVIWDPSITYSASCVCPSSSRLSPLRSPHGSTRLLKLQPSHLYFSQEEGRRVGRAKWCVLSESAHLNSFVEGTHSAHILLTRT